MGVFRFALVAIATAVGIQVLPGLLGTRKPSHFGGRVDPAWQRVEKTFRANHEGGWEKEGSAFAVFHKGKLVVDLWGGYADKASGRLWKHDTMTVAFSSTKAVGSLVTQMLVDRGLLDYDAKVTKYWPAFGKHGKDQVTVSDLVSHRAGLAIIDENRQITLDILNRDWQKLSQIFEDQVPNWPLDHETHGYHAITHGWLVDMLVRRVDPKGRSLGQFLREEVTQRNELDFHIGTDPSLYHRVARGNAPTLYQLAEKFYYQGFRAIAMPYYALKASVMGERSLMGDLMKNPAFFAVDGALATNDPAVLAVEIGAANGVGTARGLAGIFNLYNQEKLVKKGGAAWKRVLEEKTNLTNDAVIPVPIDWNCGFWYAKTPNMGKLVELGHPGYGGQNVKFVPELELSFAYLTNGLTHDMGDDSHTFGALRRAVYETLEEMSH